MGNKRLGTSNLYYCMYIMVVSNVCYFHHIFVGNKNSMLTCTYLSNGWGNNDGTCLFDENIQSYSQRMIGYDWALQSLPQHSI